MGLCKCPQRKVSTLFCFKHHVNVCESCLVSEHPQCIVRSYISWLQDNDYDPNCTLCHRSLSDIDEETIRLICFDLFHWSCLDQYCRSFPSHTAPDGYTCPTCHACIFPPSNLVSPVADQVRRRFASTNWAARLPMTSSSNESTVQEDRQQLLTETEKNGYVIVNPTTTGGNIALVGTSGLSHHPNRATDATQQSTSVTLKVRGSDPDDEDKYKRRSVFTWFARWLRSRQTTNGKKTALNQTSISRTRYTIYLILIILFVFITIITVLYNITRGDNNEYVNRNDDPQYNPFNNPFIHVAGRFMRKTVKDPNLPNDQPK
ncbi:unnamed protein product [Rotaria magnacalcarata]|uniref:RING-type domain-containing protein n=1 Tax=Rotaria magnacalcarata TaxID=392030 RepID=A0A816T1M1_9BILA|nr:unnamed protein product [Rotaria magnacalcarata]CAF2113151.1 unnamed protein product [Rotaria magnacalcarata]CAF3883632.1 unnamed protein product [Rotaria magnacalcarata]CAF3944685.1 unnamed protein product [Rotaria magnacalcarata]